MPKRRATAMSVNPYNEMEIRELIEEAEKIISVNRATRVNIENPNEYNAAQIQSIRNELIDNFLAPTTPIQLEENNNYGNLPQRVESSTSIESISSIPSTSSAATINNIDDDVLLVNDSNLLINDCASIVVDLCTPSPNSLKRQRRRRNYLNNNNNGQIDIIEIDDYQPDYIVSNARSPRQAIQQNSNEFNKNQIMCPICLESTVNRQPKSTKCGHVFCSNCIKNSLKIRKNCPICKRQCSEKQLIALFL